MSDVYTESLNKLIEQFAKLPGIGPRTAERLAFYILNTSASDAMALADAVKNVKTKVGRCQICFNLSEDSTCQICSDPRRDKKVICIVEQPKDIISLEKTGACKWVYHVLGGHIAPLEGLEPSDLTIDKLVERVRGGQVSEIVMATNPNVAGDGTSLYISSLLRGENVKITRLARGLPTGTTNEYANGKILADAIRARQRLE